MPPCVWSSSDGVSHIAETVVPACTQHVGDQEVMWEKPADGEPVGVFLLLNGCNHGADGWWDPQPACPHCLGEASPDWLKEITPDR